VIAYRKPSADLIAHFLEGQSQHSYTYLAIGASRDRPPAGHAVDHTRINLGNGVKVFQAAKIALDRWDHFRLGWAEAYPQETAIKAGATVAVLAHLFGLWWLNACKIVYVVDEVGPVARYGFAYGTLPSHVESGEERFTVEWNRADDSVWYDILAFSRPNYVIARLGYPIVRLTQKRFARDSAGAMLTAVSRSQATS